MPTLVWRESKRSCGQAPGRSPSPRPHLACGSGGRGLTVSAVTGASLMRTQGVPAPSPQPGVQASEAIWVRKCVFGSPLGEARLDGKLPPKNQPASRSFLSPGPLRRRALEISSFPLRSPEKAKASTFKTMWPGSRKQVSSDSKRCVKMSGRD